VFYIIHYPLAACLAHLFCGFNEGLQHVFMGIVACAAHLFCLSFLSFSSDR
jgi:hypothetical protein